MTDEITGPEPIISWAIAPDGRVLIMTQTPGQTCTVSVAPETAITAAEGILAIGKQAKSGLVTATTIPGELPR